mmetsp:Transcript_53317/g.159661  ORF Transcript_53317/g.159661 Transcript_53317/m.159661 type:complete len:91 (+) Transcript_53317:834-1106(+)
MKQTLGGKFAKQHTYEIFDGRVPNLAGILFDLTEAIIVKRLKPKDRMPCRYDEFDVGKILFVIADSVFILEVPRTLESPFYLESFAGNLA